MSAADTLRIELLKDVLAAVEDNDTNYDVRYRLVFRAVALAIQCGFAAGVALDPAEPDWPVVYIELPAGQVSWHMPKHPVAYDGHTTDEKYRRIAKYVRVG